MAHILLAEDDESLRKFLAAALVKAGHAVTDFGDGSDAWECLQGFTFDLLLTDIVMPGMRGNLLAERLIDLLPNLKVLFMSGYVGSALDVQDWLGARAAFLQKPFSPDLLARKLREVLDAS